MKKTVTVLGAMVFSASALAAAPASYDTKFNVSANVPDSAMITDAGGRPISDINVEMVAAASGRMEATVPALKLWNNDPQKLEVTLTLHDGNVSDNQPFNLFSTQGDVLNSMTYEIHAITSGAPKKFPTSGSNNDFTLLSTGSHGELPVVFRFVSNEEYKDLGQGHYSGTVYANLSAKL